MDTPQDEASENEVIEERDQLRIEVSELQATVEAQQREIQSWEDANGKVKRDMAMHLGEAQATIVKRGNDLSHATGVIAMREAALEQVRAERDQLKAKLAVSELNASNLAILARDRRLEIDGLVAKLAASESESASWRTVLHNEREAAQKQIDELRVRRQETIDMAIQLELEIERLRGQLAEAQARITELTTREQAEHTARSLHLKKCEQIAELQATVEAQQTEISRLREALEYYAKTAISARAVQALISGKETR